jgi:hypothetical protein
VACAPRGWKPAEHPKADPLRILLDAWSKEQFREVARPRRDFAHLDGGVDEWATMRMLRGGVEGIARLPPDAAGALRTVLAGNVVTERVASHRAGKLPCPHCRLEPEDHEHRLWRCPAWDAARTLALGAPARSDALRLQLSDGVARTGILEAQAD